MLSVNQILQQGRYHITNCYSQGESGTTYRAFDNVLKTSVIIKETSFDPKASPNPYKYPIARQMENLIAIEHESFSKIHGFFSELNHQYLVTEIIEGQNLKEFLAQNGRPFPLFTVLNWTAQLLDALIYLHSRIPPIIHREITPSNLTLTNDNKIKLLTYVILKEFNPAQNGKTQEILGQTKLPYLPLEVLWETLDYASQKVILNDYDEKSAEVLESPIDERSDVYALGATIYHLATGKAPTSALERSIDILENNADPLAVPSTVNQQIPRNVSAFLMKALEIRRENRFESALVMRSELQPMLNLIRKIELDKQRAVEDPKVRETALQEVELARQILRKQKEAQLSSLIESETKRAEDQIVPQPTDQSVIEVGREDKALLDRSVNVVEPPIQDENQSTPFLEAENLSGPVESNLVTKNRIVWTVSTKSPTAGRERVEAKSGSTDKTTLPDGPGCPPGKVLDPKQVKPRAIAEDEGPTEMLRTVDSSKSRVFWLVPVIFVTVILVVIGVFAFDYLGLRNSADNSQTATEQTLENPPAAPTQNSAADYDQVQAEDSAASTDDKRLESNTTPSDRELPTSVSAGDSEVKTKRAPIKTQPLERKNPQKVTKTPVQKKRELTVDDLINDN